LTQMEGDLSSQEEQPKEQDQTKNSNSKKFEKLKEINERIGNKTDVVDEDVRNCSKVIRMASFFSETTEKLDQSFRELRNVLESFEKKIRSLEII